MIYTPNTQKNSTTPYHAAYSIQRNKDNTITIAGINPKLQPGDYVLTKEFKNNYELQVISVNHCQSGSPVFKNDPNFQNAYFTAICKIIQELN